MRYLFFAVLAISACSVNKNTSSINRFTGSEAGCGHFIVFKLSEDGKEYISVSMKAQGRELISSQSFKLGEEADIQVLWKAFSGDARTIVCNDLRSTEVKELSSKEAISGSVLIEISEETLDEARQNEPYQVTVTLKNVKFEGLKIDYLKIEKVNVGWLPG